MLCALAELTFKLKRLVMDPLGYAADLSSHDTEAQTTFSGMRSLNAGVDRKQLHVAAYGSDRPQTLAGDGMHLAGEGSDSLGHLNH